MILRMYGDDVSPHIEPLLVGILDFPDSTATDISERLIDSLSEALANYVTTLCSKSSSTVGMLAWNDSGTG